MRLEGPRAGVGFSAGGAVSLSPSVEGSGGTVSSLSGGWSILGPQKSRQNGQLAFESGSNK